MAVLSSGAAVLAAIVVLVFKVRAAAPEPDVAPVDLARAVSAGKARQSAPRMPEPREATHPSLPPVSPPPAAPTPAPLPPRPAAPPPGEQGMRAGMDEAPTDRAGDPPTAPDHPTPEQTGAMDVATEYYDRGDYESARTAAGQALGMGLGPHGSERMLRVAASASCFMGDADQAHQYYGQLSPRGQRDIARRCRRMGIEF
ncbi:MAG TPA: hypothetical protein VKB80_28300 [Kofleriaceae bacterium]|nr:hypothetical protein [Kofleriaceae bacterium]